ncbi:helix-turn-helix domain-containing protein [Nocardioides sp.]|uniref:helix-turn-helix domain-containing protein n=1 Tax=Nocardioides sp. TaxID=35761 RepID=UPI0039E29854
MSSYGGDLVREARRRASLSQTTLAERAGTTQPGIARWESGRTAISFDDVMRLIRLCGFDLDVMLVPADDSDRAQAGRLASLSPQQRLERHDRVARQLRELRGARRA